jgi:antitoxin CcdA
MDPHHNSADLDINPDLIEEARDLDIDVARVAERAIFHAVRRQRSEVERQETERKWKEENAEAFAWANEYFEKHGFPFPQYRRY